jgi:azurin
MKFQLFTSPRLLTGIVCAAAIGMSAFSTLAEEKKESAKADVTVELTGDDAMQLNIKAFEAKSGQTVLLKLKHIGKLPKAAMGHNIVILEPGTDVTAFATASIVAGPTKDYVPDGDDAKKIVAKTKMLGGGEETSITFKAGKPGKYDYICTFPGHFALMRGVMTVK